MVEANHQMHMKNLGSFCSPNNEDINGFNWGKISNSYIAHITTSLSNAGVTPGVIINMQNPDNIEKGTNKR